MPGSFRWGGWIGVKGPLARCRSHMVGRQGGAGCWCLSVCTCPGSLGFLRAWELPASVGLGLEAFSASPATLHLIKKSRLRGRGHRPHAPLNGESEKGCRADSCDTLPHPELSEYSQGRAWGLSSCPSSAITQDMTVPAPLSLPEAQFPHL